jgi:hypothetical protein
MLEAYIEGAHGVARLVKLKRLCFKEGLLQHQVK